MMTPESLEQLLIQCAKDKRDISYSEVLRAFGFRFTRPKMRELCRLLGEIDAAAKARGEPALAALVVRAIDRMPGDGWWVSRRGYQGEFEGEAARKYLRRQQNAIFRYWKSPTSTSESMHCPKE
jgi:hypothetical protein